jgi:pimeloyl-ACP methyl ester carboxylesterase
MAAYLENLPPNAREAAPMTIPAEIPVTVLSASTATEGELRERELWAKQSRKGRHIRLDHGGHWIQLEHPEAVVDAIREMVNLHQGTH